MIQTQTHTHTHTHTHRPKTMCPRIFSSGGIKKVPGVVDLVVLDVRVAEARGAAGGRLQLPVVEAVQEHLGQVVHGLPLLLPQAVELVHHKVGHALHTQCSNDSIYGLKLKANC